MSILMSPGNANVQTSLGTPKETRWTRSLPTLAQRAKCSPLPVFVTKFPWEHSHTDGLFMYCLRLLLFYEGRVEAENMWSAKMRGFTTWLCTEVFSNSREEIHSLVRSVGQMTGEGCLKQCQCGAAEQSPPLK